MRMVALNYVHIITALLMKIFLNIGVPGTNGFLPDVSQEGVLRPFRSYADVTLFHYYVPSEVTRATWEFAAYMDSPACPAKDVHIFLQHGSYPLINASTSRFPPNAYVGRTSLHFISTLSSFEPRNPTLYPIYSPLPGNWYAAAYVPSWDRQVKQEGINLKCHYSLGSVSLWSQIKGVPVINIGALKEVFTSGTYSYYKFYVPSQTWQFSLNISNCSIKIPSLKERKSNETAQFCVSSLALNAKTLPSTSQKGAVSNITEGSGYTFFITQPQTECYYYLLVTSEARSSFNIQVLTEECRYEFLRRNSFKRLYHLQESFKSATLFYGKAQGRSDHPAASKYFNHSTVLEDGKMHTDGDQNVCPPIFRLSRIKHSEDFSVTFLLEADGWSTRWLALTDFSPIFVQLEILPFVDIGGTLSIGLFLDDLLLNTTMKFVTVTACIKKSSAPKVTDGNITCSSEFELNLTSNNLSTIHATKLIPYPEPDVWFIAFQLRCYLKGTVIPCGLEDILIELNIQTQRCVFPIIPCGPYGICQETHKGVHYFSSCFCLGGYNGWGCTDGSNAVLHSTLLLSTLLLTLSNIFFLPAIVMAFRQNLISEGLVYLATMVFSTLYHACDEDFYSYCVTKYEVLQFCDFFFSIFSFWVTLIATAVIPSRVVSTLHTVGVIIIAVGVEYNRTGLLVFIIPSALGLSVPLFYWCLRSYKQSRILFQLSSCLKMLPGIILAGIGLILFAFVETEANYQYVHSVWHIVIALSLVFLLPRGAVERHSCPQLSEAELYDVNACSASSPVFFITSDVDNLISSP